LNKKTFFVTVGLLLVTVSAFAQGPAAGGAAVGPRWNLIAAAFLLAVAAAAGAIGQSKAIVAACEGIARNPGAAGAIRLAMLIGLALIESLVIYALIIAYLVMSK
jgi:F-type H+-transporting ATPase subunit c